MVWQGNGQKRATLIGLAAILLWSTMVGLIRSVSEGLGPVGGAAMIYTLSGLLCLVTVGFPDIRRFLPLSYCRQRFVCQL
jgi:drug/metabolite transporter (DMT)-like permease